VFSGEKPYTNNPDCSFRPRSAIPTGRYYTVDRPEGSFKNKIRAWGIDSWNGTNHAEWFGLFNSNTMSDNMFVNGVTRNGFRLHPLRPDGSGTSEGCITFFNISDFNTVRQGLVSRRKYKIPGSNLMAYGYVDVQGVSNFENCKAN